MNNSLFGGKIDAYVVLSPENRFYFTGFNSSFGCVLLLDGENIFFTDMRYSQEAREAILGYDVRISRPGTLYGDIADILKNKGIKTVGYEDKYISVADFKDLKTALSDFTLKPVSAVLAGERLIKTPDEIEKIRSAQRIAEKALKKVITLIRPGVTEREIYNELMFECMRLGAEKMSFDSIVCFGESSAVPHHEPSQKKYEKSDIILVDFGVKYQGYCSDMTRTFALSDVNPQLEVIHNIVLEAQSYALKHIRAGMTTCEADSLAREYIIANGYEREFSHTLGHGVGIEIHESPFLSENSSDVLEPGMVITVEPGIYVGGLGGVRIEDMAVVQEDGIQNLTEFDKTLYLK